MDYNIWLDLLQRGMATQLGQLLFATAALTAVALFIACCTELKLHLRAATHAPCPYQKNDRERLEES